MRQCNRDKKIGEESGRDDNGDNESEVMFGFGAIVVLLDPSISVIHISVVRGDACEVGGKRGFVKIVLDGLHGDVACAPPGVAIGGDGVVIGDGFWRDWLRSAIERVPRRRVSCSEIGP